MEMEQKKNEEKYPKRFDLDVCMVKCVHRLTAPTAGEKESAAAGQSAKSSGQSEKIPAASAQSSGFMVHGRDP